MLVSGKFIAFGPSVFFFASADGEVAGLVEHQLNAADPVVVALPGSAFLELASSISRMRARARFPRSDARQGTEDRAGRQIARQYVEDGGAVGLVIIGWPRGLRDDGLQDLVITSSLSPSAASSTASSTSSRRQSGGGGEARRIQASRARC
ncbi:MAG: hypothetical protein R3F21_09065 [Myxococcota bacterium]